MEMGNFCSFLLPDFSLFGLNGVNMMSGEEDAISPLYDVLFQMMLLLLPALITGAFAERLSFQLILFSQ